MLKSYSKHKFTYKIEKKSSKAKINRQGKHLLCKTYLENQLLFTLPYENM